MKETPSHFTVFVVAGIYKFFFIYCIADDTVGIEFLVFFRLCTKTEIECKNALMKSHNFQKESI